jgi:hypothetical protein
MRISDMRMSLADVREMWQGLLAVLRQRGRAALHSSASMPYTA